ncbi:MAG: gliding motility-associated C-terminal domain-containing protein, partial [Saprospiraceae bacterium]|nr:gliding motility-associated C-terminal domain-containing protein [Saprospiraceae bacterium]
ILTVSVAALPVSSSAMTVCVCPGETFSYHGVSLQAGAVQSFTLFNTLGCDSTVTVTVFEKAVSTEIREVTVCPGVSYSYNGVELQAGETREFHYTNGEGCDSLITIHVSAWPELNYTAKTEISCPNTGTGAVDISVQPQGAQAVGFSIDGGADQQLPVFNNLAPGIYLITIRDENGCLTEVPVEIDASPLLDVTLQPALLIPCDSTQITLEPVISGDTTGLDLTWWNGSKSLSVTTGEAGDVWLSAVNHCGQTVQRQSKVEWADWEGLPIQIYVPNIFAPEANHPENTMFRAFIGKNLTLLSYRMEVYDRWGNLMFVTEELEKGWEGRFRNTMMDPGVYVWQLWAKVYFCGRELELYKKGDVTIER